MKLYTQEQVDKIIDDLVEDMHKGYVKIIDKHDRE